MCDVMDLAVIFKFPIPICQPYLTFLKVNKIQTINDRDLMFGLSLMCNSYCLLCTKIPQLYSERTRGCPGNSWVSSLQRMVVLSYIMISYFLLANGLKTSFSLIIDKV